MAKSPVQWLLSALPWIRFTDARIGRAYKQAIEKLNVDMVEADYEPHQTRTQPFFDAIDTCIEDALNQEKEIPVVNSNTTKVKQLLEELNNDDEPEILRKRLRRGDSEGVSGNQS